MGAALERLRPLLAGFKQSGRRYVALCPCHDDKNPSLSITDNRDKGRVYCRCWSCGADAFAVARAVGLPVAELWDTPRTGTRADRTRTTAACIEPFNPAGRTAGGLRIERPDVMLARQREYVAALSNADALALADHLGVCPTALGLLGLGVSGNWWTFPMREVAGVSGPNHALVAVVGWRLRHKRTHEKITAKGTRGGLFLPMVSRGTGPQSFAAPTDGVLGCFVVEGPTDAAALLTLGLYAVGRPSAHSGHEQLLDYIESVGFVDVVVVCDRDAVGISGATKLARSLLGRGVRVRLITPPAKDVRAWVNAGATAADVLGRADATPDFRCTLTEPTDDD